MPPPPKGRGDAKLMSPSTVLGGPSSDRRHCSARAALLGPRAALLLGRNSLLGGAARGRSTARGSLLGGVNA